ncbi:MAG: glycosyltransferase family 2 protein [Planctomycetota bacterium]|jgi:glycosyltransferase involved in cell wall biosynthesis
MTSVAVISVVLPTHNGSKYLDQAVASIVAQTYRAWELILVDDASTDDTPSTVDAWAAQDERIRGIHLPSNRKLPGALNRGFRQASGAFLTWTSDDNWYAPEAFARMLDALEARPEVDLVYAGCTEVDSSGTPLRPIPAEPPDRLAVHNCVGACFLYRRAVGDALGGYSEDLFLAEDYDFWLRASLRFRLEPLDNLLYYYRRHGDSLTDRRARDASLANERAVERWLTAPDGPTGKTRGRALEAMGLRALVRGDVRAGRRYLLRAMRLLRRPPVFRHCRSYAVDFLLGATVGNLLRRVCGKRP